jgi:proline iminopeptidase
VGRGDRHAWRVRDQEATRRLVLVDPVGATSAWLPGLHEAALRLLRNTAPEAYSDGYSASAFSALDAFDPATLVAPDPVVHSAYARAFYPAWFADRSLPAMFAPPRSSSVTGATVAARLRREGYDWREAIRALRVPSLVIHGEQDVLAAENSRQTVSLLSDARLELLADAGHMPFWEAPDRFFSLVEAFLAPPPADTPLHTG